MKRSFKLLTNIITNQFLLLFIFTPLIVYNQNTSENKLLKSHNYNYSEEIINVESGLIITNKISNNKNERLIKVPLIKCSYNSAYFEKGNLFESEMSISIETKKVSDATLINEVFYTRHKYGFKLPDSSLIGIYSPQICAEYDKNLKPIKSTCEVFLSSDEKRVYIYLQFGKTKKDKYVVWILQEDKYFGRIIGNLND